MQVGIFRDEAEVAQVAAQHLIEVMSASERKVLGIATGSSPLPLYELLRQAHSRGEFTLRDTHAFALDEYIGMPEDHPEGYRNVLRAELVGEDKTGLKESNLHTPDGSAADLLDAAKRYDAEIASFGGVALQILGIGANGHIGFNEPGGSLVSRTHVDALTCQTREDNARFFGGNIDEVPKLCLTQGLGTIMDAEEIMLIATGKAKAEAVAAMIEGGVNILWPASILQMHPNVYVFLDDEAASHLKETKIYQNRWEVLG